MSTPEPAPELHDEATEVAFSAISEFLNGVSPNPFDGPVARDTPLMDSGLDSLCMLQLIMFLGEKINVEPSEEDFQEENFHTVGTLASYISTKMNAS